MALRWWQQWQCRWQTFSQLPLPKAKYPKGFSYLVAVVVVFAHFTYTVHNLCYTSSLYIQFFKIQLRS